MSNKIPDYCDFHCPHADFAPAYTAGICRTMSAVWCRQLKELVNKNAPCEFKKRGGDEKAARTKSTKRATKKKPAAKKTAKKSAKKAAGKTAKKRKTTKKSTRRTR